MVQETHLQNKVLNTIIKHKIITQPAIIELFLDSYKNRSSARQSVSIALAALERKGLIKRRRIINNKRGSLPINEWRLNNKEGEKHETRKI